MDSWTDISLLVSCQMDHEEDFLDSTNGSQQCPEEARETVNLLQDVIRFKEELRNESQENHLGNKRYHLMYYSSLENLKNNFVLLFPTFQSRLSIVFKTSSVPRGQDLFIRNVTGTVWLYLAGTLVLLALCLRMSTYIHHRLKPRHSDWSWLDVIQWSLGAICQQGSERHPQGCSCRTMFLIGYTITYMIYTGYAAGITSLLALRTEEASTSWYKALRLGLSLTAVCGSDADRYLKRGDDSAGCVQSMEELIAQAEGTSGAMMMESSLAHYLTSLASEEMRCEVSTSRQSQYSYYSGFALSPGTPLTQSFNYWLLRFKESGLLSRIQRKRLKSAPACRRLPSYTQVGVEHVQSALFIIEGSVVAALLVICCEILLFNYKRSSFRLQKRFKQKQRLPNNF